MIDQILSLLNTAASAVVSWFTTILVTTGAGKVYIAMMAVVLSTGILLSPLLGSLRSGLSDVVRRPRNSGGDNE